MMLGSAKSTVGKVGGRALTAMLAFIVAFALAFPLGSVQKAWADDVTVTVGEVDMSASTSNLAAPFYSYNNNSGSETIYTAAQIGKAGLIKSIAYNARSNSTLKTTSLRIFMGHVKESAFTDNAAIVPSDMKLVYSSSANLAVTAGWNTFTFDSGFAYNGEDNLAVIVMWTGSYTSSGIFYSKVSDDAVSWVKTDDGHTDLFQGSFQDLVADTSLKPMESGVPRKWPVTQFVIDENGGGSGGEDPVTESALTVKAQSSSNGHAALAPKSIVVKEDVEGAEPLVAQDGVYALEVGKTYAVTIEAPEGYAPKAGDTLTKKVTPSKAATDVLFELDPIAYKIAYSGVEESDWADGAVHPTAYTVEDGDIAISAPARTGYAFDGWTVGGQGELQATYTIAAHSTGDVALTANWTQEIYSVTKAASANGSFDVSPASGAAGTTVTVTPKPEDGYVVDKVTYALAASGSADAKTVSVVGPVGSLEAGKEYVFASTVVASNAPTAFKGKTCAMTSDWEYDYSTYNARMYAEEVELSGTAVTFADEATAAKAVWSAAAVEGGVSLSNGGKAITPQYSNLRFDKDEVGAFFVGPSPENCVQFGGTRFLSLKNQGGNYLYFGGDSSYNAAVTNPTYAYRVVSGSDPVEVAAVDGVYSFTLPAGGAEVAVTFKKATHGISKAASENGSFTVTGDDGEVELTEAAEGATVQVNPTPAENFRIDKVAYTPASAASAATAANEVYVSAEPATALEAGESYVFVAGSKAMKAQKGANSLAGATVTASAADGCKKLEFTSDGEAALCKWVAGGNASGWTFANGGKFLAFEEMYGTKLEMAPSLSGYGDTFTYGVGGLESADGDYGWDVLKLMDSSGEFLCSDSSGTVAKAYKVVEAPAAQPEPVEVQANADGKYQFAMPASAVEVAVTFAKVPQAHAIAVAATADGTVSLSADEAFEGTEVTVTATPDVGCELDKITWAPEGGQATDITEAGAFTMPDAAVTVTVTFKDKDAMFTVVTEDGVEKTYKKSDLVALSKAKAYEADVAMQYNNAKVLAAKPGGYVTVADLLSDAGATWADGYELEFWGLNKAGSEVEKYAKWPSASTSDATFDTIANKMSSFFPNATNDGDDRDNVDGAVATPMSIAWEFYAGSFKGDVTAGSAVQAALSGKASKNSVRTIVGAWADEDGVVQNPGWRSIQDLTKIVVKKSAPKTVKVTFVDEDGATVLKEAVDYTLGTKGSGVAVPSAPTKADADGYSFEFAGWVDAADDSVAGVKDVTADVTYKATYSKKPIEYKISYNNLEGAENANPAVYTVESETILLADVARDGYTFGGWFSDPALETQVSQIAKGSTGDVTLYAKWTIIPKEQVIRLGVGKSISKTLADAPFSLGAEAQSPLTFASSNVKVAMVSDDGVVTLVGTGTATITVIAAETESFKGATCEIKLTVSLAAQSIGGKAKVTKSLKANKKGKLSKKATVATLGKGQTPTTYTVKWTGKAKKYFSVSKSGKVTAKKGTPKGSYQFTVTATAKQDGKYSKASKKVVIVVKVKSSKTKTVVANLQALGKVNRFSSASLRSGSVKGLL